MKLSMQDGAAPTSPSLSPSPCPMEPSYPLRTWVAGLPGHQLSSRARKGACHTIEGYMQRLASESSSLRTRCFRAMLETVIRAADPTKKRLGVQTMNKSHLLSFEEYIRLGLQRVGLDPHMALDRVALEPMLGQQQRVVAFLSLAPVLIYLQEQGFQCELIPLFNPIISPRNLVLVVAKTELGSALDDWVAEDEEGAGMPSQAGGRDQAWAGAADSSAGKGPPDKPSPKPRLSTASKPA